MNEIIIGVGSLILFVVFPICLVIWGWMKWDKLAKKEREVISSLNKLIKLREKEEKENE